MFLRSAPTETIATLIEKVDDPTESLSMTGSSIRLDHVSGSIDLNGREVPLTEESMIAIGNWLNIPTPFLKRLDDDLRSNLLNEMLWRSPSQTIAKVNEEGLKILKAPNSKEIEPPRLVETAARVMGEDAIVVDFEHTIEQFRFDVVVGDDDGYGVGGDSRLGDLTKGGLRFAQNLKQNLAPWVQPYFYRLICTNGMEIRDDGLKVEGRGNSVESVLEELELAAQRAFSRVESQIAHFYDLRNDRVGNPERVLARMARERGLAERATVTIIDRLPSVIQEDGSATMFDLINLITNAANDPTVRRWGARRELETFGGMMVGDHVDRCSNCASRLN